jgi:hypothetical protein
LGEEGGGCGKAALVQGAEMTKQQKREEELKAKEKQGGRVEIEIHNDSMAIMEARLRFWSIQKVWKII